MAAEFRHKETGKKIHYAGITMKSGLMRFEYESGAVRWYSREDFQSLWGRRTWYALNTEARALVEGQ